MQVQLPYLNIRKELSNNRPITFIGASITTGKTLGVKMFLINEFLTKGKRSIFLVRTKDQKKRVIRGFFDEVLEMAPLNGYSWGDLTLLRDGEMMNVVKGRFDLTDLENRKEAKDLCENFCIVATLREVEEYGSNAWTSYDYLYLDEFTMSAKGRYVPDEFFEMMKFCKNIFRTRPNCKLICSGNSHDFDNPYFTNLTSGYYDVKAKKFVLKNIAPQIDVNKRNNLFRYIDVIRPGQEGMKKIEKGPEEWYWSYPNINGYENMELKHVETVLNICAPTYASSMVENEFTNYDVDGLVRITHTDKQYMRIRVNRDVFYIYQGKNRGKWKVHDIGEKRQYFNFSAYSDDLEENEEFLTGLVRKNIDLMMMKNEISYTQAHLRAKFGKYFGKKAVHERQRK